MTLPERHVAMEWVGKMVVDGADTEIGVCTAVFADDATGLPEWLLVDLAGATVFVPVVDAAESGGQVLVTVSQADVASAPTVGDAEHLTEGEEAALYRHYSIETSRDASDSLLPEGAAGAGEEEPPAAVTPPAETAQSTESTDPVAAATPSAPTAPSAEASSAEATETSDSAPGTRAAYSDDQFSTTYPAARRLTSRPVLVVGGIGTVVGGVVGARRLLARAPATPLERITSQARTVLTARQSQLTSAAAAAALSERWQAVRVPLTRQVADASAVAAVVRPTGPGIVETAVRSGRLAGRVAGGAGRVVGGAGHLVGGAGRLGTHSVAAAGRMAIGAAKGSATGTGRLAASGVSKVASAATAGVRRGQRNDSTALAEVVSDSSERLQKRWRSMMGKITSGFVFATGYVLGARAGRERFQQIKQAATTVAQQPEVQQATDKVKSYAGDKLQGSAGKVTQKTADLAGRMRGRGGASYGDTSFGGTTPSDITTDVPVYPASGLAGEPLMETDLGYTPTDPATDLGTSTDPLR